MRLIGKQLFVLSPDLIVMKEDELYYICFSRVLLTKGAKLMGQSIWRGSEQAFPRCATFPYALFWAEAEENWDPAGSGENNLHWNPC